MDYFCYISRSKIDQLFHTLNPEDPDEWTEQQSTEQHLDSNVNADLNLARIVSLFKAGISYGRKGVIQRERKIKLEYTEKLRRVLAALARQAPIPSLSRALASGQFTSLYFHHAGTYTVAQAVTQPEATPLVSLQSSIGETTLSVDCSLRFFSEGNEPDGQFVFNSINGRFFAGKIPLQMESVFMLLHRTPNEVIGTPLYLKLAENAPVAL